MITILEIFAANLKNKRKELGLTQEQFAERIDIAARNLTDLENAKYMPVPANIDKICRNLNIPVVELFQIPSSLLDDDKQAKIKSINEKLSIMDIDKINIIYNIVDKAF